ncbi:hypothetical protein T265_03687 [Opisthorchis viverrini]|uniref:Zinc finger CHCC-type domain-containing protein n=1 Tax=Opisthorchis viverrini TaxID=6198 RepID=A0A074ZQT9_OPIVI|nr:hypothetical protein T265_03687 [Opisthorchis viverrini]KER29778.1 hypothetical protein T265_03687 [Opisthorchis viverrini]
MVCDFFRFSTTDASEAWPVLDGVSVLVTRWLKNGYLVVLQAFQSDKTPSTIDYDGSVMWYACQNTVYRSECCSPCLLQDGANREDRVSVTPSVLGWRRCKKWRLIDVSGVRAVSFFPDCPVERLEVNRQFAEKLIAEVPPIPCTEHIVSCDGGGGALGHPKVYINLHQKLRWLGHVLRMPNHHLPKRVLFYMPSSEWRKQRGGQPLTEEYEADHETFGCCRCYSPSRMGTA